MQKASRRVHSGYKQEYMHKCRKVQEKISMVYIFIVLINKYQGKHNKVSLTSVAIELGCGDHNPKSKYAMNQLYTVLKLTSINHNIGVTAYQFVALKLTII